MTGGGACSPGTFGPFHALGPEVPLEAMPTAELSPPEGNGRIKYRRIVTPAGAYRHRISWDSVRGSGVCRAWEPARARLRSEVRGSGTRGGRSDSVRRAGLLDLERTLPEGGASAG